QPRDAHRLARARHVAPRRARPRRADVVPAGGHALRRSQDPRDGDHRRARAHAAPHLRRRGVLPRLPRAPRLLHRHPHAHAQGRRRLRPGGRGHRRRFRARDRVPGDAPQGARRDARRRSRRGRRAREGRREVILFLDNYDSFTYNLVQYLGEMNPDLKVVRNDKITVQEALALKPSHIVVSPGPCTPHEAGISMDLIAAVPPSIPLLGVCLGHQAIGAAFGGTVLRAPEPLHGKTSTVEDNQRDLFAGLPKTFTATRYHSLIVEKKSLPANLEVTALTKGATPD